MPQNDTIAQQFEANRSHLRGVAFRMLASASDAEDAVQEAWLRLNRSDATEVENLRGWLTTVVARVSLDMLRSRKARSEDSFESVGDEAESVRDEGRGTNPEWEAELADSVGVALLVVLNKLSPPERLAFVLHDTFGLPFSEISSIVGCSTEAARQLASRARRRVRGTAEMPDSDFERQREVVSAFLTASHGGDFTALVALLDPNIVLRADTGAVPPFGLEVRGTQAIVSGAKNFNHNAPHSHMAVIDGQVGIIVAPNGRLRLVLVFTLVEGKIAALDIIADSSALEQLELSLLPD